VLLASGAFGFLCGAWLQPTWQVVIEPSQIFAGLVTYPPNSPAALFAARSWTILHQLTALAMTAGVTERVLAITWSGLVGVLSFQALALTALAMGTSRPVAALTPLLVFASGAARFVPGYPVDLVGFPNTWGMVAHGLLLLVLALLALQRYRAAALMLGIFPAVHIGVGLWAWIIVGLAAVPLRAAWQDHARTIGRWAAAGLAVALASGVVHMVWFTVPAPPPGSGTDEILRSLRLHWDSHRLPLAMTDASALAGIALAVACVVWHRSVGRDLPRATWWLTTGFIVAVALALAADLALRVLPEDAAVWVARPMPRRLLSLPLLGGMAWLIGLCTGPRAPAAVRMLSALLFGTMAMVFLRPVGSFPVPSQFIRPVTDAFVDNRVGIALLLAGATAAVITLGGRLPAHWQQWCDRTPGRVSRRLFHGSLIVLAVFVVAEAVRDGRSNMNRVQDRTNNALLETAASRPGVLLTAAGLQLVQAATRRTLLLDLSLIDVLVYTPEAAATAEHIVQRAYGMTLTLPPPPDDDPARLPGLVGKVPWTTRTAAEWRAVGEEFGVTDVLTPAEWPLHLPLVMRDEKYALWTIPRPQLSSSR
jgi:hypothetical protein